MKLEMKAIKDVLESYDFNGSNRQGCLARAAIHLAR